MRFAALLCFLSMPVWAATGLINVQSAPYSCVGDGVHDDTACVQAALDAVPALNSAGFSGAAVYAPAGQYGVCKPLFGSKPFTLNGDGPTATGFVNATDGGTCYWLGPVFIVAPDLGPSNPDGGFGAFSDSQIATAPALLDGGTTSMYLNPANLAGLNPRYLDLTDGSSLLANGKSHYTVEIGALKIKAGSTGSQVMWSTGNEPGLAGAAPSWFAFSTSAAGGGTQALSMNLNVGGSQYGCSTTLTEGSSYGVALTYDGANVKGWVGPTGSAGSLICTRPVVGTIVQSYFEDTTIGGGVTGWPPQATTTTVADAWLDSVRFSSVARYTSSYTPPTSKFTVDANTQLLLNFDTTLRNTVVGQAGGMPGLGATFAVYLPVRSPYPLPVGAVTLSGFGTYVGSSIGLFLGGTTLFHGSDLRIVSRNGIEVEGQAFTSSWNNVRVENFTDLGSDASAHNAVYGWSFNGSNGFTKLSNILQQGGAVSLASRPVTGPVEISNYDHVVTDDSRFSWMLWGNADGFDQVTLASSGTDFETGAPQYRGTVYLNGVSGFTSYGSILNSGGSWSGHSPVIWDLPSANGDQVTLSGTVLVCKTGDPCCIYREGANQFSLSPLGVRQRKTAAGIPLQCHGTGQP